MDEALGKINIPPVLLIGGEKDLMAPPSMVRGAANQIKSRDKEVEIYPGLAHAKLISASSANVMRKISHFLIDRLR